MDRPSWAPEHIDLERPSAARIYDYLLEGSYNFEADRALARQMLQVFPEAPEDAQANRGFRRAVRMCVEAGIDQLIDVGSGIPTVGNVHEVAQQVNPSVRVLYVDLDPVAVVHSRAILAGNDRVRVIHADLRNPDSLLDHPQTAELIDFRRPVALLLVGVLHSVPDEQDPPWIIRRYAERFAPGSRLVISHVVSDTRPEMARRLTALTARTSTPGTVRTRALFDGWDLVNPGVVPVTHWRPDSTHDVSDAGSSWVYAGVGRRNGAAIL